MMGNLARDDDYDPFEAEKYASPLVGGLARATGNVISGLARDIPAAGRWFLGQAAKPEAEAQADVRNVMGGLATQLGTLPERAIGASQTALDTGVYNPAPAVETALTMMGGSAVPRVPVKAGEVAVGSGPIRAYHSSPHDFDKFDLAKIGTGEGAQAYGHGLYFAENPAVSGQGGQYWKQFYDKRFGEFAPHPDVLTRNAEQTAADFLQTLKFDQNATLTALRQAADRSEGAVRDRFLTAADLLESGKQVGPRTYEVSINADPAHMLDWDKPLAGQKAYDAMRGHWDNKIGDPAIIAQRLGLEADALGQDLYHGMAGMGGTPQHRAAASASMREAGVLGIKYLDQGSRAGIPNMQAMLNTVRLQDEIAATTNSARRAELAAELAAHEKALQPSHNYVMFDPDKITILKKYGIAGAAAPLGALAATDAYQPQGD